MKLLLDSCVWGGAKEALAAAGHDALWAGDWPEDPGDEEILERARADGRVLVTLDKDFGELAVVKGKPHAGILRLVNFSAERQAQVALQVIARHGSDLTSGAIITAEASRVRIRPPL